MATLRETRTYALSGGVSRGGNASVFHVKLTDSAAKAIEGFRNRQVMFWGLFSEGGARGTRGRVGSRRVGSGRVGPNFLGAV